MRISFNSIVSVSCCKIMRTGVLALIVFLISALAGFTVPAITLSYQEPVTVQVPYEVEVPYTEQVEVEKTQTVLDHSFNLAQVALTTYDFEMESDQNVEISWSSMNDVILFGIVTEETYNNIYQSLVRNVGLTVVITLLSGGSLAPLVIPMIVAVVPDILLTVASGEYYKLNTNSDLLTKNLESGLYKAFVLNLGSATNLSVDISYDYTVTETVTRYRTETRYRDETKIVDATKQVTLFEYIMRTTS